MNSNLLLIVLGSVIGLAAIIMAFGERLFPGKYVYTEIEIEASPETVWAVLADNENYPAWNPYHVQVTGKMSVGEQLIVYIHKPNGEKTSVKPHLLRLIPNQELTWGGGIHGLFYGEHVFLLEEIENGRSRLIHKEAFTGLAVQFVPLEAIDEGYALMNEALKQYIEGDEK